MKKHSLNILLLFVVLNAANIGFSQELILYGEPFQGNLMLGIAKDAKQILLNDTKLKIDKTGVFVFGFDMDANGVYKLSVKYKDGKFETRNLNVLKRNYSIEKIDNIDDKFVSVPVSERKRIEKEKILMREARSKVGKIDTAFFLSGFMLPVWDTVKTGDFGSYRIMKGVNKGRHNGVDFDCDEGTPIFAISDGIVQIAGDNFFYNGNFVLLDHGQGLSTIYLHMSKLDVISGQKVRKGDKIGEVGSTGRSTGPHLHWGAQWYNKLIDPLSLSILNELHDGK
ncbi:MAG: M23 family metallopeptidase [bacterium]